MPKYNKSHLDFSISALAHNLKTYKALVAEGTKVMCVVKAEAYGLGVLQLVKHLVNLNVDYFAVAKIQEGIYLRENGIKTPILIFNPDLTWLGKCIENQLEPTLHTFEQLEYLSHSQLKEKLPVHIELDTGMNRLGFKKNQLDELGTRLNRAHGNLNVLSIFSHFSASEDKTKDAYSNQQIDDYLAAYTILSNQLGYKPLRHISNSGGAARIRNADFEYIRLGIGMFGIDENIRSELRYTHRLSTKVIQIKELRTGEYIGYNLKGKAKSDMRLATLPIGYADGLMRKAGNGNFNVWIKGKAYPTIGNVCMDLFMIDIGANTDIKLDEEVIIFGPEHPIEILAKACETIPYEILTRISMRITRRFLP